MSPSCPSSRAAARNIALVGLWAKVRRAEYDRCAMPRAVNRDSARPYANPNATAILVTNT